MADPVNTGGGNSTGAQTGTTGSAGAAQTEFKVPDGKVLIDTAEHERFRQNTERVRGMQGYFEAGSKYGFKKPDDFGRLARLTDKGLTLDQLLAAMDEQATTTQQGGDADAPMTRAQWEQEKAKLTQEWTQRSTGETAYATAFADHKLGMQQEKALVEKAIAELLGENPTPWEKETMADIVEARLNKARGLYPDGHALHPSIAKDRAELRPFTDKDLAPIWESLKKARSTAAGAEVAAIADEAAKKGGRVSTPAGSSSTASTKKPDEGKPNTRPGGLPPAEDVEAAYKRRQAGRGRGPVSSLSG